MHYSSSSENLTEWKTRSRTPSSDEPFPSPTSSVKAETSSTSNSSPEDDSAHAAAPTLGKREYSCGLYSDYYAAYPQDILQGMDTQFSKYSYDLHEGSTAIPFIMAQAPADTHAQLVAVDRKLWTAGGSNTTEDTPANETAAATVLERFQNIENQRLASIRRITQAEGAKSEDVYALHNDRSISKRAAFIAKSQASKHSLLVVGKSANQRRPAMHKNKKRRSIMLSPPPTDRKHEQKLKPELPAEQTRPTILILNQKEDNQRRDMDSALQGKRLDLDNTQHVHELMEKLGKAMTEDHEANEGQIVGEKAGVGASN
ncbi:uncharacterized protein EKO05_0008594 [Ascochyta rabiei]|nr:uncharacterized protein EKO05_0008594 [Ascochyta rabiei]UPX18291.1 hypothetical protein EKO05_0008594 [Ascochyta rabiei]